MEDHSLFEVLFFGWIIGVSLVIIVLATRRSMKVMLCPHTSGVLESESGDVVCIQCGKNLGFVGAWFKSQSREDK